MQLKRAYKLILPDGPVYDYIEGLIPRAEDTYQKLAEMIEKEETEKNNKEIAARKSRLGATTGSVSIEVKREVFGSSPVRLSFPRKTTC